MHRQLQQGFSPYARFLFSLKFFGFSHFYQPNPKPRRFHTPSMDTPPGFFDLIANPSTFNYSCIIRDVYFLVLLFCLRVAGEGGGFTRFGDVDRACKVFEESMFRDVVTRNVMIDGFVKAGEIEKERMMFDQIPDRDSVSWGTLLAVLSACAQVEELTKGKKIHDQIERDGIRLDSYLGTGLVDMYAKCGSIRFAKDVFDSCLVKNVSLWNAMPFGLAMHGNGKFLLKYFSRMVKDAIRLDGVTILGVLVGCSHSRLINEAGAIFREMESVYDVPREYKHYGCMADLLGHAGLIKEAVELIQAMPMGGDVCVWGGLLGGCKICGNLEVAKDAANHVMEVKPEDGGVYSVLAHMYVNAERWDDLTNVRRLSD